MSIPEKCSAIFELFNKDDEDIHNKEGSGIGLYLVKAQAHNGKIKASSQHPRPILILVYPYA